MRHKEGGHMRCLECCRCMGEVDHHGDARGHQERKSVAFGVVGRCFGWWIAQHETDDGAKEGAPSVPMIGFGSMQLKWNVPICLGQMHEMRNIESKNSGRHGHVHAKEG